MVVDVKYLIRLTLRTKWIQVISDDVSVDVCGQGESV